MLVYEALIKGKNNRTYVAEIVTSKANHCKIGGLLKCVSVTEAVCIYIHVRI